MQGSLQKQPQIKILPVLSVNEKLRLQEEEIDEVIKTVQSALPWPVDGDDVTITLVEKNLKFMANMALMKEAITYLVRNAMPGYGKFSMPINQIHFEIESLLNANDAIIGACAFIPLAGIRTYISVDEKIKEKILEPFYTTKTDGNGLCLTIAYRIITQHQDRIKLKSRAGRGAEVNMYLPLTKLEVVNMMSM